jgi:lipoprotein-anchoring transpeptidase ErfK/SrfK
MHLFTGPARFPHAMASAALLAVACAFPASAEPGTGPTAESSKPLADTQHAPGSESADTDTSSAITDKGSGSAKSDSDSGIVDNAGKNSNADANSNNAPSEPSIVINIDKSTQHMTVFVDGIEKYNWPVSTGRPEYATPSGTYTPKSMNKVWYSKQWDNAPMPHAIFFDRKGHAIHGSYEVKYLGTAASHGCVRISPKNATVLFNLVKERGLKSARVVLAGVTPGGENRVASPSQNYPAYPPRGRRGPWGYDDQYGYNDYPPAQPRRWRWFFRPDYQAPPPQGYEPRPGRRWFRAPGY